MGSVNISITEDVYQMLSKLKKEDESFSKIIKSLIEQKDITRSYGLLMDRKVELEIVEKEAVKARKQKWGEASF